MCLDAAHMNEVQTEIAAHGKQKKKKKKKTEGKLTRDKKPFFLFVAVAVVTGHLARTATDWSMLFITRNNNNKRSGEIWVDY